MYADLLFEIKETEVPPKKEKKEGEEEEEEDDETKEKRKRNEESKSQLDIIQAQLFNSWIMLSQKYSAQVEAIQAHLTTLIDKPTEFIEALEHVSVCLDDNECQSKNVRIMAWFFNFIQIEVTWLDEVAEGLKNIIASTNGFRNFFDGLPVDYLWKAKAVGAWDIIIQTMR